jgi:hypothetical protein
MRLSNPFKFECPDISTLEGHLCFVKGEQLFDKHQVIQAYAEGLNAPNLYFGENWDAFRDCLLDLDWVQHFNVFIIHDSLPKLKLTELAVYVDILRDCVEIWSSKRTDELVQRFPKFVPHRLHVYFPRECEKFVQTLLPTDYPKTLGKFRTT